MSREPASAPCSTECKDDRARAALIGAAQVFLVAVEANDRSRAPLTADFRMTENAVEQAAGEGLWSRAARFASRQFAVDTVSGQVMVFGAVHLSGALHPYGLRLATRGGGIAEAEAMVSASAHGHFADVDQLLKPDVLYDAPVPADRGCADRAALQAVGETYWTALNESDGSLARFSQRCDRYGNGKKITNSLDLLLSPDAAVHTPASLITATRPARPRVVERRFPVLDLARGVCGSITLVEFGKNADRPDVGAFYIFGLAKIVDDEFRNIDHLHAILPAGTLSGWQGDLRV